MALEDNRIIINKLDTTDNNNRPVVISKPNNQQVKDEIQRKFITAISELNPTQNTPPDRTDPTITRDEQIANFLSAYDDIKSIMTDDEIINFFETVKLDIPEFYLNSTDIVRTNVAFIEYSQGILITNRFEQNNYQFPVLKNPSNIDAHTPYTITMNIKPKTDFYTKTILARHYIPIEKRRMAYHTEEKKWVFGNYNANGIFHTGLREIHNIGFILYINDNNSITLKHMFSTHDIDNDLFSWKNFETITEEVTSLNKLKINEWNYISFGITDNGFMFTQIRNDSELDSNIDISLNPLPRNDTMDIKRFLYKIMNDNEQTIYNNVREITGE